MLTRDQAIALEAKATKILTRRGRLPRRGLLDYIKATHPDYRAGWFHRKICADLEDFSRSVAAGESPRVMLFAPPRHGKSEIVSRRFPVWHLGHNPDHEIILASYGQELADDHSRAARELARSEETFKLFPGIRPEKKNNTWYADYHRYDVDRISNWTVGEGGSYKSVGVGGPITGRGCHVLLIDDPTKDSAEATSETVQRAIWEWYATTAYTRVATGGGVLLMMTRWTENDLAGKIWENAVKEGKEKEWKIIRYPAIAEEDEEFRKAGEALHEERWPLERLQDIRKTIGERAWQALYQQSPVPRQGGRIKREYFIERYTSPPKVMAQSCSEIWISVDAARKDKATSDYHAMHVYGVKGVQSILLDRMFEQMTYPTFERSLDGLYHKWRSLVPPSIRICVLIEDTANGGTYLQVKKGKIPFLFAFNPGETPGKDKSKIARSVYHERAAESGLILLPDPSVAPWIEDLLAWWAAFPFGKYDDDEDAASQFFMRRELEMGNRQHSAVDMFASDLHSMGIQI